MASYFLVCLVVISSLVFLASAQHSADQRDTTLNEIGEEIEDEMEEETFRECILYSSEENNCRNINPAQCSSGFRAWKSCLDSEGYTDDCNSLCTLNQRANFRNFLAYETHCQDSLFLCGSVLQTHCLQEIFDNGPSADVLSGVGNKGGALLALGTMGPVSLLCSMITQFQTCLNDSTTEVFQLFGVISVVQPCRPNTRLIAELHALAARYTETICADPTKHFSEVCPDQGGSNVTISKTSTTQLTITSTIMSTTAPTTMPTIVTTAMPTTMPTTLPTPLPRTTQGNDCNHNLTLEMTESCDADLIYPCTNFTAYRSCLEDAGGKCKDICTAAMRKKTINSIAQELVCGVPAVRSSYCANILRRNCINEIFSPYNLAWFPGEYLRIIEPFYVLPSDTKLSDVCGILQRFTSCLHNMYDGEQLYRGETWNNACDNSNPLDVIYSAENEMEEILAQYCSNGSSLAEVCPNGADFGEEIREDGKLDIPTENKLLDPISKCSACPRLFRSALQQSINSTLDFQEGNTQLVLQALVIYTTSTCGLMNETVDCYAGCDPATHTNESREESEKITDLNLLMCGGVCPEVKHQFCDKAAAQYSALKCSEERRLKFSKCIDMVAEDQCNTESYQKFCERTDNLTVATHVHSLSTISGITTPENQTTENPTNGSSTTMNPTTENQNTSNLTFANRTTENQTSRNPTTEIKTTKNQTTGNPTTGNSTSRSLPTRSLTTRNQTTNNLTTRTQTTGNPTAEN